MSRKERGRSRAPVVGLEKKVRACSLVGRNQPVREEQGTGSRVIRTRA